jgi:alkylation response protein AidB-like acyl-CoA dehydrogenase
VGVAITREHHSLQLSVRRWADAARPRDVVRAREQHPAPDGGLDHCWTGATALGLVAAGLPGKLGGADGDLLDTAAALEAAAGDLVPGPLLPTTLAALLLARHADPDTAGRLVPDLADGSARAAVALAAGDLTARREPDGALRVDGTVTAVLGAAPGTHLVLAARDADSTGHADVWLALGPGTAGLTVEPRRPLDFSRDVADVRCDAVLVPADAVLRTATTDAVRDLAATLAAAEAAGIAAWCLDTATAYAGVREQFGRKIGSFQAVKHLCAEMLCRREEAVAVAWDAARAAGREDDDAEDDAQQPLAAAVAAAVALDAAVENAKACIQVLGGIGFTWEHDAHLYLRRALATRQWLGGGTPWRQRAAALTRGGARRRLHLDTGPAGPADDATAAAVRDFAAALPADPAERRRVLADSGYLMPHWPQPWGRGASAREQLIVEAELDRAGVERPDIVIGRWAVPTIVLHGTDEQRERFVRPTLRGEITWCQLFSEPGAGSDLASLRTRAERVEDGWALTGQKVWTSLAHRSDWAICLARTSTGVGVGGGETSTARRHDGITYFLVDMRTPGIEIRPLREITGREAFNEVFLDGVLVPDDCVVGPVGGGWRLARTTLAEERVAIGGNAIGTGLERILTTPGAATALGDERLGRLVGQGTAVAMIGLLTTARRLAAEADGAGGGTEADPSSAVTKLLGVRQRQEVAEAAFDALGPDALAPDGAAEAVAHELLVTRALSIAGGTTQVLLTLAAERILGLPREPSGKA